MGSGECYRERQSCIMQIYHIDYALETRPLILSLVGSGAVFQYVETLLLTGR